MAKRIDVTKLKIALIIFGSLFLLLIALVPFLDNLKSKPTAIEVVPAFAPAEYAYPEFFTGQELTSGYIWKLSTDNTLQISNGDKSYTVTPEGIVYENRGNSYITVEDQSTINDILTAANEAKGNSDVIAQYFHENFENKIIPSDKELTTLFGNRMTPEQIKELLNNGISINEILSLLDKGYSPKNIIEVSQPGMDADQLTISLEKLKNVDSLLENALIGTGFTVDELKQLLKEYGLTPEEYLAGLNTIQNDKQKDVIVNYPPANKSNLPDLTIDLGGNASKVEENEAKYKENNLTNTNIDPLKLASALSATTNTKSEYDSQNNQSEKTLFMQSFSSNSGSGYLTTNDIASGTIISMTLKTGINTDLPGIIVAEVSQNIFDSLTGSVLLIPKGTRLIASYDSSISWGQKRALIAWTQLIRPDGFVLQLPGLPGVDKTGYSGYNDKVDNHTWDLIKAAFLSSVLDLAATEVTMQAKDADLGALSQALTGFTNTLESAGQQYLKKQMNIQPTIKIRPGRTVKLLVNQTITLIPYKY